MDHKTKRKVSVSEALSYLFGYAPFGRSEYVIPGEQQISIEGSDAAYGNADGFANDAYYARLGTLPCFSGMEEDTVRSILDRRQFHIVCGKTDITLAALESVYELRQKYGVRKFLLLASDAGEREQLTRTLSVMQDYFSDKYYGLKMNITTYDSEELSPLRTFALSDDIQLLIINKEYFIRKNNRIRRPSTRLGGLCPAAILQPARCIAITVSEKLTDVRAVLNHADLFDPLCTICFTKDSTPLKTVPTVAPVQGTAPRDSDSEAWEPDETDTLQMHI